MGLPCVVKVRVEAEELAPSQIYVVNMLVDLLTHVEEVLPRHRVIYHSHPARLFVTLSLEEGRLFT